MAFFQRVFSYLLNEVKKKQGLSPAPDSFAIFTRHAWFPGALTLCAAVCAQVMVNSLANNRAFQRFAIRSSSMLEEVAKKGVEHKANITEQSATFFNTFREEMKKGLRDINSQQRRS
jgi:hypothetical protein